MSAKRIGVYPGTFDPVTRGHLDIIQRATHVVDKLVVGVAGNDGKGPIFLLEERLEMLREEVAPLVAAGAEIVIRPFDGLLIHFCHQMGARLLIRGLRAVSDFEYEFQMAAMNRRLDDQIETVFLMASERQQFVSSRFVKEISRLGGDVSSFVGAGVLKRLSGRQGGEN